MKSKTIQKTLISLRVQFFTLDAGTDGNGNPRRGYLVIHNTRGILACCNDNYDSRKAMNNTFGNPADYFMDLGTINVSAKELKSFLKLYPDGEKCEWKFEE